MKKTLLNRIPDEMPRDIQRFVSAANIYDTSCSPEAKVYFIDKGNGYYLKCSSRGMLEKESKMTEYFYAKGLGVEVLNYISDTSDWLITDRTSEYIAVAEKNYCTGNYDKLPCPDSLSYRSAKEAHDVLTVEKDALQSRVLLHGDYCLPKYHERFLDAYGRDKADESVLKIVAAAEVFG